MAEELETERSDVREDGRRPPRAVVGSHRVEEEMFGKAFDGNVVKRIWAFVRPYRREVILSVCAVLTFTLMQLMIPLIIRYAIDHGMQRDGSHSALTWSIVFFLVVILINYVGQLRPGDACRRRR
jgi:ATP-binding cassette subfamily B multidrug efflux pump